MRDVVLRPDERLMPTAPAPSSESDDGVGSGGDWCVQVVAWAGDDAPGTLLQTPYTAPAPLGSGIQRGTKQRWATPGAPAATEGGAHMSKRR